MAAEVAVAQRMIERAADRHGLWPRQLIGDTGYGSASMLAWLCTSVASSACADLRQIRQERRRLRAHDFIFDHGNDSHICPAGKRLRPRNHNFTSPPPETDKERLHPLPSLSTGLQPMRPEAAMHTHPAGLANCE